MLQHKGIINCSSSYECRSFLQDRDPLTVPSTRRNPVLADVFNRLGYMERKGSGSDRYQFTVVMPNLNYSGTQDGTQMNVCKSDKEYIINQIKNLIKKDNKISTEKMSVALGISVRTIKRRIKENDEIQFIGRGSNGHWEIQKKEKQK